MFSILAIHEGRIPPTINLDSLDPDVHLDVVRAKPRALGEGQLVGLNNSFGFGGHNVALVFRTV